jgi:hypothetical protein
MSVATCPGAVIESESVAADSPKVGAAGGCWMVSGTVSVCWMTPETAVTMML